MVSARGAVFYVAEHAKPSPAARNGMITFLAHETAKALVNGGMSQRKAAKVLDVSHPTVMRNPGGTKNTKSGSKRTTKGAAGIPFRTDGLFR
jgi:helix-turn-helix, Psq domain